MKTIMFQGRRVRAPKFKLGDKVRIRDLRSVGKISFNSGYDDYVGQWRYKVAFASGSRTTWNEKSLVKVRAKRR